MTGAPTSSTRVSRVIKAPQEALYDAFLDPAGMEVWLPPGEMAAKFHAFDARAGGGYEVSLFYPDSESPRGKTADREDRVRVRFDELIRPERIVETVTFESNDTLFAGEMKMIVTFERVEEGTVVTIVCSDIPRGIRPEDNETGSRQTLENLAQYMEL